jgi:hypothetical protein
MTTISFTNGIVMFSDVEIRKIAKYFATIDILMRNTKTNDIKFDKTSFDAGKYCVTEPDFRKETFLEMIKECDTLQLDGNKHITYDYFGCRIPIGIPRENMYKNAVKTCNFTLLEILHNARVMPTYDAVEYAIIVGNEEFMMLMIERDPSLVCERHQYTGRTLLEVSAAVGKFQCLKMLHSLGAKITNKACVLAYGADSLACFKYTYEVLGKCDFGSGTFVHKPNCSEYYRKYVQQRE